MIEVEGLKKAFRKVQAVENVSFQARDGAITGLIGPNGAGKTTTLRILYTILRPDAGAAAIDGFDTVRDRRRVQQRIGACPITVASTSGSRRASTSAISVAFMAWADPSLNGASRR